MESQQKNGSLCHETCTCFALLCFALLCAPIATILQRFVSLCAMNVHGVMTTRDLQVWTDFIS
jgi:hypothetical protein